MTDDELEIMERLHDAQLKILTEFDRICRKFNIIYYLTAGTLLGAVRHQDFIPWDDDIDVFLTRPEYERFMKHIDEFKEPFEIVYPKAEDKFFWDYTTRLVYKNVCINSEKEVDEFYHKRNNVFLCLDIFVLDKTHAGLRNKLHIFSLKVYYGLAMSRRHRINYSGYSSVLQKVQVFVLSNIGKLIPMLFIYKRYNRAAKRYCSDSKAKFLQPSNLTIEFLRKSPHYQEEWYGETDELLVRGKPFLVPKQYKKILAKLYSNYMQLPPEEKRIPEHISSLYEIEFKDDC